MKNKLLPKRHYMMYKYSGGESYLYSSCAHVCALHTCTQMAECIMSRLSINGDDTLD